MGRKTLALLLCALLLLVWPGTPANAEQTVFFAAVDFEVLSLSSSNMPIYSGGILYAPLSVFTHGKTGIFSSLSDDRRMLSLFAPNKMLTFDLDGGITYDQNQTYSYKALTRDGSYYLPVEAACAYFGLTSKVLDAPSGQVLRIRVDSDASSDQNFLQAAQPVFKEKLDDFTAANATPEPTGSVSPTVPPSPSATPEPRRIAYLTFDDGPSASRDGKPPVTDQILDTLDRYQVKATFFLLGSNLTKNEPSVRRIVGSGHAIGLHSYTHKAELFYANKEAMLGELNQTNDLLDRIAMVKTRLVRVPFGSYPYFKDKPELKEAMSGAGYRFWDWNLDGDAKKGSTPEQIAAHVIEMLEKTNPAIVLLHDRQSSADALPLILDYMKSKNYITSIITESERPSNYMKWIK